TSPRIPEIGKKASGDNPTLPTFGVCVIGVEQSPIKRVESSSISTENEVILLRRNEPGSRGGWNVTTGAAGRAQGQEKTIPRVADVRRQRASRADGRF